MTLLLSPWFWLALAVAAAGFAGKGWIDEKANFDSFKGGVEALGKQAQERVRLRTVADKSFKEKADAQNKLLRSNLTIALNSLRIKYTGSGGLSAPAPSPASPDRICFDPAKLDRALRNLGQGLLGIVETGSQAIIDLDSVKQWVKDHNQFEGESK